MLSHFAKGATKAVNDHGNNHDTITQRRQSFIYRKTSGGKRSISFILKRTFLCYQTGTDEAGERGRFKAILQLLFRHC